MQTADEVDGYGRDDQVHKDMKKRVAFDTSHSLTGSNASEAWTLKKQEETRKMAVTMHCNLNATFNFAPFVLALITSASPAYTFNTSATYFRCGDPPVVFSRTIFRRLVGM